MCKFSRGPKLLPARHIPQTHCLVSAATGQHLSVKREGQGTDPACVPTQRTARLAISCIPKPDDRIVSRRGYRRILRVKCDGSHATFVPGEVEPFGVTTPPKIVPLKAAEVFLTGLRTQGGKQLHNAGDIALLKSLLRETYARSVKVLAALLRELFGALALFEFVARQLSSTDRLLASLR